MADHIEHSNLTVKNNHFYHNRFMENQKHILVISDEENSPLVEMLLRLRIVPVIRRSIMSAINLLRHLRIIAIIIDEQHQDVDSIELILNARDIAGKIPIFVTKQYQQKEDWTVIRELGKVMVYDDKKYPLDNEIINLLNKATKNTEDI